MVSNISQLSSMPLFYLTLTGTEEILAHKRENVVTITSWKIDGETMETMTDFIFTGSKITVDGDCSLEIEKCLLLGRKAMTNPDAY